MLIGSIINDGIGLLSKQLRFYCWHFRRNLDQRQRQELIELLHEQHFERLANKIRNLNQSTLTDCKQQIGKLLFDQCLIRNKRHQLIQLIESGLVDINVRLDNYGRTLLHRSAYNLDVDLVRILIEQGVNIRLRDYAGNTALHIAIQSYRNGANIYGNGLDVVKNLTAIIRLLLDADRILQKDRFKHKRVKLVSDDGDNNLNQFRYNPMIDKPRKIDPRANGMRPSFQASTKSIENSHLVSESDAENNRIHQSYSNTTLSNQKFGVKFEGNSIDKGGLVSSKDPRHQENSEKSLNPILLEDLTSPLVDTKNTFGRTALHYCVLVVGEQHLDHFVQLLISYRADTDAVDTRMETPLYCLVKRPGISAIKQKCLAITHLLNSGCDDLGLAIDPKSYFADKRISDLEASIGTILQSKLDYPNETIFTHSTFRRIPSLKHISRLRLVKLENEKLKLNRQTRIVLPLSSPSSLNLFVNRKLLDQSDLF